MATGSHREAGQRVAFDVVIVNNDTGRGATAKVLNADTSGRTIEHRITGD
jgi:hypothetical protein